MLLMFLSQRGILSSMLHGFPHSVHPEMTLLNSLIEQDPNETGMTPMTYTQIHGVPFMFEAQNTLICQWAAKKQKSHQCVSECVMVEMESATSVG